MSISTAMRCLNDDLTLKLFDSKTNQLNPAFIKDMQALEEYSASGRMTFLGPIYAKNNWEKLQKALAPVLGQRIKDKADHGGSHFMWIAPSDPYWSKSERFISSLSDFIHKSSTRDKRLYKPVLYVPVSDDVDSRLARQWKYELGQFQEYAKGIVEGLLDGNVEILHLENELSVVIYHISQAETLPVTMPLGFITTNKKSVKIIGALITEYLKSSSGFDKPHDCGFLSSIVEKC